MSFKKKIEHFILEASADQKIPQKWIKVNLAWWQRKVKANEGLHDSWSRTLQV